MYFIDYSASLSHHGVKGMKWGVRNDDGTHGFAKSVSKGADIYGSERNIVNKYNSKALRANAKLNKKMGTKGERRAVKKYLNTLGNSSKELKGRAGLHQRLADKYENKSIGKRGTDAHMFRSLSEELTANKISSIAKQHDSEAKRIVKEYGSKYDISSTEVRSFTQKGLVMASMMGTPAAYGFYSNPKTDKYGEIMRNQTVYNVKVKKNK